MTADTLSRYVTEKKEETHFSNDKDLKLLHIQYKANDEVKQLLQNLAREQGKEPKLQQLKQQPSHDKYAVKNNILFKLMD